MSIIETHETLSPVERYQLLAKEAKEAAEKERAARDEAIQQLRREIDERVALLNQCGFNYSLMERENPETAPPPTEVEAEVIETPAKPAVPAPGYASGLAKARAALAEKRAREKAPVKKAAPAKKEASPFTTGTQYEWIYGQFTRNGGTVHMRDILAASVKTPYAGLANHPGRLTVALAEMAKRGVIEHTGEQSTYRLKGARH